MIKDLRVLEGDWGTVGSVKQWTYVAAGRIYTHIFHTKYYMQVKSTSEQFNGFHIKIKI